VIVLPGRKKKKKTSEATSWKFCREALVLYFSDALGLLPYEFLTSAVPIPSLLI
jgi:hypothetical protein